ncbi:MAG: class I SAM-dependent methyltransferase [Clostridium sp.]|uniref:class I SAM-dependent methyltransferase n=1 Tax=Clostridium sp. TaxID=1506 RepID=UPI0025C4E4C9|nr:class I SAM-dependent methyltransferase [Clostridium sp.]MCH3963284.1 class I SAM-dependent methyltransferase [Clostridium sp.]MCI1717331.1 class I SAM-dependent methyltransferase [Clostridium sp.]MCI1801671.1 class I SAM-dependent methyltransferase [Clostridium sp.]MCI1815517.1 class I SAM-dependent methyltransferase [Clostridium sp.]MCI1872420.1 class I SAM-dependent methyltransferase [Clostridium sp.]
MIQKLTGIPETLLIPLWARAVETKRKDSMFKDYMAVEMVEKIDYDFSKFDGAWVSQTGVAVRTELFDNETRKFINRNSEAVIVNIGCGLDTRYFRVDNGKIVWYDLDLPEPIRIKKKFLKETKRYRMISKSVLDYPWIQEIDALGRAVLIIAEGVLMYFEESEIKELMNKLVKGFPESEMIFEMMTPMVVKGSRHHDTAKKVGVTFKWGIKSGKEMLKYNKNIEFVSEKNFFDYHKARWRWLRIPSLIPAFKNNFNDRLVHLRFL